MKQFENIFRTFFLALTVFFTTATVSAQNAKQLAGMDSVEVGLLTCSPHDEVYSLYGHSALCYHDRRYGQEDDVVFNYGLFDFRKPHFVTRFVFGLTDYELGLASFEGFCNEYRRWGSEVTEQILNLTREEKWQLTLALANNLKTENRVYRYNYFYDNCSTRPRNIIEQCIRGTVVYGSNDRGDMSYRQMIHLYTAKYPWATFGNDILLGVKADLNTTQREQQFLPAHLRHDFDKAMIDRGDGQLVPLVKERRQLVSPGVQMLKEGFPLSPMACSLVLLALTLLVLAWEWRRGRTLVWWDVMLMLLTGLSGCIIFVMLFSQHPATSTNLTVLLLNPLPLLYIYKVARRRPTYWFKLQFALVILFFIGGLWQHYADGLYGVALCLLLRFWRHLHDK